METVPCSSPLDISILAPGAPKQTENSNFTHGKAALTVALQWPYKRIEFTQQENC